MLTFTVHVWILWLLYAGTLSDKNVPGCEERPCQNGGVCESHRGGSRCLCSRQSQNGRLYGGDTCTVALSGCDANQCVNGGICSPLLVDGEHTYTCLCLAGFTGPTCQTPTVFSFESRGYMYVDTQFLEPEAPVHVTFSFRTDRLVGTLLQHRVGDLLLSVELTDGYLCLQSRRGQGSRTLVQELLPENLSNSKWHTVEASLRGPVSLIRLICTEGNCTRNTGTEVQLVEQAAALPEPGAVQQSLFIGAAEGEADHPPALLGCFRDVFVGSRLVLPVRSQADFQANVTLGCSDRDKCTESPCQNRGRCVSHGWRSYSCECHRPYEGTDCTEEYVTARFGNKDLQSYAVFSLDGYPGDAVTVSMFIRTRQPRGLLLVLANSTSQYLRLWMEEGRVKVQVNHFETLVGRAVVNDGHFHLVTVKLDASTAFLFQSTQIQATMPVRNIQAHQGDQVFLGGLPDPRASASFGGYFKGCVQDLRVNTRRLQFYPITTAVESYHLRELVHVDRGCSTDNACAVNPCLNDGVCYSMWDDFICNCPPNTAGQRCEEVKWCALSPCPTSAVCQPQSQGFECLSNVTFRADSRPLHYRSNGKIKRSLHSVSLSFRTRQSSATLLHAQKDSHFVTVSVQDAHLVLDLQVGLNRTAPRVTTLGPVSDGEWHTVELRLENHTFPNSPWILNLDGGRKELLETTIRAGGLDFLRDSTDVFLGGTNPDAGAGLSGCLGPVNIGGILLPYHPDSELNLPRPQEEQFVRVNVDAAPRYGCWGSSVCTPNPCQNQGVCEDLFDLHHCTCPPQWTGELCRDPADSCVSSPCIHGNCINLSGRYKCACEAGFRGERCEAEVDMCENSNCSSGATCLKGFQSYSCLCPHNRTGPFCSEKLPEIPWYIEINPLPQLPVSTCMGKRWNYSCFNGGNCSNEDNACSCLPGFTGEWCEKDVDECASEPCMNGGFCLNYINSFECVCDMNYSGIHCQMDISDFYLYLFLGLWQNLFQLVSYLVMRLDDEPEIEWGFNFND